MSVRRIAIAFLLVIGVGCRDAHHAAAQGPDVRVRVSHGDLSIEGGDSVKWRGQRCRIIGFDAPELPATWFNGSQEPWAGRARAKLTELLGHAQAIDIVDLNDPDKYGRRLVQIYADGRPVGVDMIRSGLAYETVTRYGHAGLASDAEAILKASRETPKPEFEDPYEWRRTHYKGVRGD